MKAEKPRIKSVSPVTASSSNSAWLWTGLAASAALVLLWADPSAGADKPRHAIAMHGEPALPDGFAALPYVNAQAPKGGRLVQGVLGTFDSLNPFIVKGLAAPSIRGYVIESLMARGYDEPFTLYGLLAQNVETDSERSYVTFTLDPAARFSDGKPVTPDDVIFSWQILRDKGRPNLRTYYSKVVKAEAVRRMRGALRSGRQRRPRIAADPRPDADPAQTRHRSGQVRGDDVRAADRQRSVRRQGRAAGSQRDTCAQSRLLGRAPSRSIAACGISTRSASNIIRDDNAYFEAFKKRPVRRAVGAGRDALADRL